MCCRSQAARDGVTLEAVPVERLGPAHRVLCDLCANSIPDLHRSCAACGWDLCLVCCREAPPARCPNAACGSPAAPELKRFMKQQDLADLRAVAKVRARRQAWSWR